MVNVQGNFAYCTLLTNDVYEIGALVLAQSLKNTGTKFPLCVLVMQDAVSTETRQKLATLYDRVIEVPGISGLSTENLKKIGRPDLHATLTKLQPWSLTEYERVIFLDADTLVLQNLDHLFSLPKGITFAASPELGFPDCFNSGVMLLTPSNDTLAELKKLAGEVQSFDGGDQGLLNIYFGDGTVGHPMKQDFPSANTDVSGQVNTSSRTWHRLSFTYNMEMHKVYRLYISAVRRYSSEHKVLHFIGKDKPWHIPDGVVQIKEDDPEYVRFYAEMVGKWWQVRGQLKV